MKNLLCSTKDVQEARGELLKQQKGIDPITKQNVYVPCVDHAHDETQQVRGIIGREVNSFLGKVENSHARYVKYQCDLPLADVLRNVADYLEADFPPVIHTGWMDKCTTKFKSLNAEKQKYFLNIINSNTIGSNATARVKSLRKILVKRLLSQGEFYEIFQYLAEKSLQK